MLPALYVDAPPAPTQPRPFTRESKRTGCDVAPPERDTRPLAERPLTTKQEKKDRKYEVTYRHACGIHWLRPVRGASSPRPNRRQSCDRNKSERARGRMGQR